MFWKKRQKKIEMPQDRSLFREAFFPAKKTIVPKRSERRVGKAGLFGVATLWLTLLATATYILFVSPFHSITDVSVTGMTDVRKERLEVFLRDLVTGKRLFVFPKDNFFLFSSAAAEESLSESFPKLRSVEIRKRFPNRMEVTVSERDRIPLWCSSGACFLLGDDGKARDARFAEQSENEPFLFRIEDSSAQVVASGDSILDERTLFRVLRLERGIRESGAVSIVPRAVSPSRVSGEFRFTTTDGWDILVSTEPDPETTVAALRLVLEKELPEERRAKLRYIDLRTEKKAFYSFIPDEPAPAEEPKDAAFSDSDDKKPKDGKKK